MNAAEILFWIKFSRLVLAKQPSIAQEILGIMSESNEKIDISDKDVEALHTYLNDIENGMIDGITKSAQMTAQMEANEIPKDKLN
jgi:hypothetical protein